MTWHRSVNETPAERARRLVARITKHGTSRRETRQTDLITSVGSERTTRQTIKTYLTWLRANNIPPGEQDYSQHLIRYLAERRESVIQKTLDRDRRALERTFHLLLPEMQAARPTLCEPRSYTLEEMLKVAAHQSERNRISTLLAYHSGARAHELATIRRREELAPSSHRNWRTDRFVGMVDYAIYVVIGKGGLVREIAVPQELAKQLEQRRRPRPVPVRDREIYYDSCYAIGFGQALSQSFSQASQRVLGWSTGFHGLRHSHAKRRLAAMLGCGVDRANALGILAQELGHFRENITLAYLR